jgi:hypothetical protein
MLRHVVWFITLMMEAANTSETSVILYITTQSNIPENSYLYTCYHENLKSHKNTYHPFKSKVMCSVHKQVQ